MNKKITTAAKVRNLYGAGYLRQALQNASFEPECIDWIVDVVGRACRG
jgi:hypothetical protein